MRPADARLTKRVRSEIIRRELNAQKLIVSVIHGVVYLGGELGPTRHNRISDWKKEMEIIEGIILRLEGIRGLDNRVKWVGL